MMQLTVFNALVDLANPREGKEQIEVLQRLQLPQVLMEFYGDSSLP